MTDIPEPVVVGADIVSNLDRDLWAFEGHRVLFHVEIMCAERVFTQEKSDVPRLARYLADEVAKQLEEKIPRYDRGDRLSKETYSAFLRYRKELAEIHRRHGLTKQ